MPLSAYLQSCPVIDWRHPAVMQQAAQLAAGAISEKDIVKRCFEFVRDQIRHSWDYRSNPVTCKASDVLLHGTGYCFAKSHLLAALLRANGIPAGLCYQRLTIDANGDAFCLHGLNAVYLKDHGWHRLDARGNKPGVDAQFHPPAEKLAFAIRHPEERDLLEIWVEPLPVVVRVLTDSQSVEQVFANLPDLEMV